MCYSTIPRFHRGVVPSATRRARCSATVSGAAYKVLLHLLELSSQFHASLVCFVLVSSLSFFCDECNRHKSTSVCTHRRDTWPFVHLSRPALPALTQPPQRQMPALPAPLPMMPAPMMQPLQMPQMTAAKYPPPAGAPGVVPSTSAVPRGFCKYWLPEQVFATKQDIKELIAGPGGAHFMHVLKKYPAVELKIDGAPCRL